MELYPTACKLLEAGFSIIPVDWEEKKPTVAWKEYQTRYATKEEAERWFSRGESNIAIVTGVISNLCVVDVDPRNGGQPTISGFPLGRATVVTGGGGYHHYYRHLVEAPNCQPGKWKGIDIKATGGYVLCPPSKTQGGYFYTYGEPFPPERREWPATLRDLVVKPAQSNGKRASKVTLPSSRGGFIRVTLNDIESGGRNNHAAKLYGALLYEGASQRSAAEILRLWNSNLTQPLPSDEIEAVITSITAAHVKKKGQILRNDDHRTATNTTGSTA